MTDRRLKAYFIHGFIGFDDCKEYEKIIDILASRKVKIHEQIVGNAEYSYEDGREVYLNHLRRIRECDMVVAWMPHRNEAYPNIAYSLCYTFTQVPSKFIQVITPLKYAYLAYIISGGNQLFEDIEAFEKLRRLKW